MADTPQSSDLFDLYMKDDLKSFKSALTKNKKLANCSLVKYENILIGDEIYKKVAYSSITILEFCINKRQNGNMHYKNNLQIIDVLLKGGAFSENITAKRLINLVYTSSYYNDRDVLAYTKIIKNIFNSEKWLAKAQLEYSDRDIGPISKNYDLLPESLQNIKYTTMLTKNYILYRTKKVEVQFWEIIVLPKEKLGEIFHENQKEDLLTYLQNYFSDKYNVKYNEIIEQIYNKLNE